MHDRFKELKERDVRRTAPELDPTSFLDMYVASNFPQTSALPSAEQKALGVQPQAQDKEVNFKQNMKAGTGFDNPASY